MSSTPSADTISQMNHLSKRLDNDPRFMAWVLNAYQLQEKISNQRLLDILNTTPSGLARLSLCIRPDSQSASFAGQIGQIAEYAQIDTLILATIVRQVESIEGFAQRPVPAYKSAEAPTFQPAALLSAARDREEDDATVNGGQQPSDTEKDKDEDNDLVG